MFKQKKRLFLLLVLILSLAVIGCSSDDNASDTLIIAEVDIDNQIAENYEVPLGTSSGEIESNRLPETIRVELSNGEIIEDVSLSWDWSEYDENEVGEHNLKASFSREEVHESLSGSASISTAIIVEALIEGPDFRISDLKVNPTSLIAGLDRLAVTALVQNFGEEQGEQNITIKILDEDGELMTYDGEEMKETIDAITLDSGASEAVEFVNDKFPMISSGDYTVEVKSDDHSATVGLEVKSGAEVDVEDAKIFAENLKNHGVDLYNLGQREAKHVEEHFNEEVIPYTKAVGNRLFHIGELVRSIMGDGEVIASALEEEIAKNNGIEKQSKISLIDQEFPAGDHIIIEVTNPDDIIIDLVQDDGYFKLEADFTKAEFSYLHTHADDPDFKWSLDISLNTTIDEKFNYSNEEMDLELLLPKQSELKLEGAMTDSSELFRGPEIGELKLDLVYGFDLEDNKQLFYSGKFDSEVIKYEGQEEINFRDIPSYQDITESNQLPKVDNMKSEGKWWTDKLSIAGNLEVDFIQQDMNINEQIVSVSVPDLVEFNGKYESSFEGETFKLNGGVVINPDYSNFDLTAGDTDSPENYLAGEINLSGSLNSVDFAEVTLDVDIVKTGYDELISDFEYNFDGHRYIAGEAKIDDGFKLTANNELGLEIVIQEYSGDRLTIGEITGEDGTLYAYIRYDEEPYIDFADGTSESLGKSP